MKGLVRFSRGQMKYTRQPVRAAFATWVESPAARVILERLASRVRFAPFGRVRAARRRLWRQLAHDASTDTVAARVQRELDAYLPRLQTLAYADGLPRLSVELRRVVVVPRLLLNAELYRCLDRALEADAAFAVDGDIALRDWFILSVIQHLEAALAAERLSPWRPVPAGDTWIVVGVNQQFEWRAPFAGHAWPGHFYLLELRRIAITRAVRSATRDAVAELEEALPSLSGVQRTTLLRAAAETLQSTKEFAGDPPHRAAR